METKMTLTEAQLRTAMSIMAGRANIARQKKLSPQRRSEIASIAAKALHAKRSKWRRSDHARMMAYMRWLGHKKKTAQL